MSTTRCVKFTVFVTRTVFLSAALIAVLVVSVLAHLCLNLVAPYAGAPLYFRLVDLFARFCGRQMLLAIAGGSGFLVLVSRTYVGISIQFLLNTSTWAFTKLSATGQKASVWLCGTGLVFVALSLFAGDGLLLIGAMLTFSNIVHFFVFKYLQTCIVASVAFLAGPLSS